MYLNLNEFAVFGRFRPEIAISSNLWAAPFPAICGQEISISSNLDLPTQSPKMAISCPPIAKNGDFLPTNRQKWRFPAHQSPKMAISCPPIAKNGDFLPTNCWKWRFRVWALGFRGLGFGLQDLGARVWALGFRAWGLGFTV